MCKPITRPQIIHKIQPINRKQHNFPQSTSQVILIQITDTSKSVHDPLQLYAFQLTMLPVTYR